MKKQLLWILITQTVIFSSAQPIDTRRLFDYDDNRFTQAKARFGHDICDAEKIVAKMRHTKAHKVLQQFTNTQLNKEDIPRIGVVCSGGAFRAAVAGLGLLQGLERINLLDATSYLATLSGSTWSTASWYVREESLDDTEAFLRGRLHKAFYPNKLKISAIAHNVFSKIKSGRHVSLNDIWGGIIANVFLKTNTDRSGQNSYLSDIEAKVARGHYPIPLFTSIIANQSPHYKWMEFSPFEVGSDYLQTWIPSWAFGKKFNNGYTSDASFEENFGYLLGMFGSAYAISVYDSVNLIKNTISEKFGIPLPSALFSWISNWWFGNKRISPPKVYNPSYYAEPSPLRTSKYLKLVDAGIHINLPFPPLLRRDLDVYIVCDASGGASPGGPPLLGAQQWAEKHYKEFPRFDYKESQKSEFSVFIDEKNPKAPVVIYVRNSAPHSTFDFDYDAQEFTKIISNVRNSVVANHEHIKHAIGYAIKLKQNHWRAKKGKQVRA